jgi:hypothetical protein
VGNETQTEPPPTCTGHLRGLKPQMKLEPTRGLEPRTYRLQDFPSTLTMTVTSDFIVYGDRSSGHSCFGGRQFASQVVSRRSRRCRDLLLDPLGYSTACIDAHVRVAAAMSTPDSRCYGAEVDDGRTDN